MATLPHWGPALCPVGSHATLFFPHSDYQSAAASCAVDADQAAGRAEGKEEKAATSSPPPAT